MAARKKKPETPRYHVLRDQQEKARFWEFPAGVSCTGTETVHLKTGDYTLQGYEHVFIVERKGSMGEFAQNLFQPRFERELERLDLFEHPYLVLEFTWDEFINFPEGSGIPRSRWKYLRVTPQGLVKRFHELRLAHPKLRIECVGANGRAYASSLFKRITEHYGHTPPQIHV
jgi:hypothetical protein